MKFKMKGNYNPETKYDIGDVVLFENGEWFFLEEEAPAGTPPTSTWHWNRINQQLSASADLMLSMDVNYEEVLEAVEELGDLVEDATAAAEAAETAAASASAAYGTDLLAPDYSTTATYAVGDYVIYDGDLYRCTTAIASGESWTSGHWAQVTVGSETSALKNAITSVQYAVWNFDITNLTKGVFYKDGTGSSASSIKNFVRFGRSRYNSGGGMVTLKLQPGYVGYFLLYKAINPATNDTQANSQIVYYTETEEAPFMVLPPYDAENVYSYGFSVCKEDGSDFTNEEYNSLDVKLLYHFYNLAGMGQYEGTDLNEMLAPGIYTIISTSTAANRPTPGSYGIVISLPVSGIFAPVTEYSGIPLIHIFIDRHVTPWQIYMRYKGSTFGAWSKITSLQELEKIASIQTGNNSAWTWIGNPQEKLVTTLKVGSYNVAQWRMTNGTYIDLVSGKIDNFKKWIARENFDFLCLQEAPAYLSGGSSAPSAYAVMMRRYFVTGRGSVTRIINKNIDAIGNSVYGNVDFPILSGTGYETNRNFAWEIVYIGTKKLLIISTHHRNSQILNPFAEGATFGPADDRMYELKYLFNWIYEKKSDETHPWDYCIVCGDFNTSNYNGIDSSGNYIDAQTTDYDNLTTIANYYKFNMANGEYLGWFNTYPGYGTHGCLDNILVSSNINITQETADQGVFDELYSDHLPVTARLELYDVEAYVPDNPYT